jgi:hypothetical protein
VAAITATQIEAKRVALMSNGLRLSVIVAKPDATSDATAGVFLVKDPDPGDAPNTVATQQGNAKGGNAGNVDGLAWKAYSFADVATAYGV